mgnify:CR=1 FL=1
MDEFKIFKELIEKNPKCVGYIILDAVLPFYDGRYNLRETLEDLSFQPGIDREQIKNLLERVK